MSDCSGNITIWKNVVEPKATSTYYVLARFFISAGFHNLCIYHNLNVLVFGANQNNHVYRAESDFNTFLSISYNL